MEKHMFLNRFRLTGREVFRKNCKKFFIEKNISLIQKTMNIEKNRHICIQYKK
jgi:hypothetical protein